MEERTVRLRNGAQMPRIGLGTWKSPAEVTKQAVQAAVRAGYRLIDCANDYDNEHVIGEALKELLDQGEVKREELFIQAKLWNSNHRPEHVRPDLEATLKDLQLDYVDSFVIHWPMAVPSSGQKVALRPDGCYPAHFSQGTLFPLDDEGYYASDDASHFIETWYAMEDLVDEGLTKSIGLSNFNMKQVREVLEKAKKHLPSVVQNESHPYLQERDFRAFCRINGIVFQAYSALGSADRPWRHTGSITSGAPSTGHEVLDHPILRDIAQRLGRSVAHVVLRWHLQIGGAAVCKSVTPSRIQENIKLWDFALAPEDMDQISNLNVGWRHLLWAETSMHNDYPFKDWLPSDYKLEKPSAGSTAGAK
ncbi:aldo-keto reductase family 1 member B1-like [Tigriopus californicus]|nr:aldo-keto reductase family 1 member B1-like [Tigriopus californicus]XP_059097204.1 aldo-keto reductase family 1 member B1-like [Tigriopus californicus]